MKLEELCTLILKGTVTAEVSESDENGIEIVFLSDVEGLVEKINSEEVATAIFFASLLGYESPVALVELGEEILSMDTK